MRLKLTLVALGLLLFGAIGCGGKPADPVTNLPAELPGGPPPPENRPTVAISGGAAPAAGGGAAQPAASNSSATGNVPRNLPSVAIGGGGGGAVTSSVGGAAANQPGGATAGSVSNSLANGLYPQGMAGGGGTGGSISGGLQNGLYPQFAGGGGGGGRGAGSGGQSGNLSPFQQGMLEGFTDAMKAASGGKSAPRPAVASALAGDNAAAAKQAGSATKLLDQAKELFAAGEDEKAANALYAYMLAKEDAYESYPLEYYPGIKKPLVFLRIGVGVTYTPQKGFSEKPPVIGDPVAGSKANRRPPPGGDGSDTIGNAGFGGPSASSNSPYSTVDTSTPAGFLLYYTGDYIEKLYQGLNTRRKSSKGAFGKILSQIPDRIPSKPPAQGDAPQTANTTPQGGGGPPGGNRPTFGIGGGGGAPAGGAAAGGAAAGGAAAGGAAAGGAAAGGNQGNAAGRGSRKLVDLWSGSNGAAPERGTFGTLMPGITCLGEGKKDDLITRAKKFGVDVVLLFDVKVGEAKGEKYTTTTLRLIDPENPEDQLALGRQLKNTSVMESRDSGKDPVEAELARVLDQYIDVNLIPSKFPDSVNQEAVAKRLEGILAAEVKHPLKTAAEVLGFYRVGLLKEAEVENALKQLLSEDLAAAILSGDEGTRVTELQKLLEQD